MADVTNGNGGDQIPVSEVPETRWRERAGQGAVSPTEEIDPDIDSGEASAGVTGDEGNVVNPTPEVPTDVADNPENLNKRGWKRFGIPFGAVVLAGAGVFGLVKLFDNDDEGSRASFVPVTEAATTTTTSEAATSTTAEAVVCANTWVIEQSDNSNHRWFANGVEEIKKADSDPEAREAFKAWLHRVEKDPDLLAGAAAVFLENRKPTAEELTAGPCASDLAEQIAAEIELAVAAGDVKPSEAPANGRNSGADSAGNVVTAEQNGISGDRKALFIITINGEKIWVMGRCGNPVTEGNPGLPGGPTDEVPLPPEVPPKYDDGELPGDGTPAAQDPETPDNPGVGPAGQKPGHTGYLPGETPPPTPPEVFVPPQATNTLPPTPATTGGSQPTAPPAPPTTGPVPPNTGTMPPKPPV